MKRTVDTDIEDLVFAPNSPVDMITLTGTVLVHRYAGILSAYGMGLADVITEAQEPTKLTYGDASLAEIRERGARLEERVTSDLRRQRFEERDIKTDLLLNLRYEVRALFASHGKVSLARSHLDWEATPIMQKLALRI
jgi:hypothetical protein